MDRIVADALADPATARASASGAGAYRITRVEVADKIVMLGTDEDRGYGCLDPDESSNTVNNYCFPGGLQIFHFERKLHCVIPVTGSLFMICIGRSKLVGAEKTRAERSPDCSVPFSKFASLICHIPPSTARASASSRWPTGSTTSTCPTSCRWTRRRRTFTIAALPDAGPPAGRGPASSGAARILLMGAHVLRAGVSRYLIDLMERGLITHIAMNGAGPIHDWEFALIGATTESVARYIQTGEFGLWQETGRMNDVIRDGAARRPGPRRGARPGDPRRRLPAQGRQRPGGRRAGSACR